MAPSGGSTPDAAASCRASFPQGASHGTLQQGEVMVSMRPSSVVRALLVIGLSLTLFGCGLLRPHMITAPDVPSGPTHEETGRTLTYTTGGSTCRRGHTVEYRFDWGDGSFSGWKSSVSASTSWSAAGTYVVRAQARCSEVPSITGDWSPPLSVTIDPAAIGDTRSNAFLAITLRGVEARSAIGTGVSQRVPPPNHVFLIADVEAVALQSGVNVIAESFVIVQANGHVQQRSGATAALDDARLDSRGGLLQGQAVKGKIAFEVHSGQPHYTLKYAPDIGEAIAFTFSNHDMLIYESH